MTLSELLGTIKLSYRQAECRRFAIAVLCLKYISSIAVTCVAFWFLLHSRGVRQMAVLTAFSVAAAMIAVYVRGTIATEMYLSSENYLSDGKENRRYLPGIPALLSGELVYLAAVFTVRTVMLFPAYLCLKSGIRYYSLSSDRQGFMLLTASAILLAAGGIIFAAVISARLGCAEYLWLDMQCPDMLSALDCSWQLTYGDAGDILRLRIMSFLLAPGIGRLCEMNYSQRLLRCKGMPATDGLRLELWCDLRGEQHLELV